MINVELTREEAISLLLLIDREQELYSTDHTCPARVAYLREVWPRLTPLSILPLPLLTDETCIPGRVSGSRRRVLA